MVINGNSSEWLERKVSNNCISMPPEAIGWGCSGGRRPCFCSVGSAIQGLLRINSFSDTRKSDFTIRGSIVSGIREKQILAYKVQFSQVLVVERSKSWVDLWPSPLKRLFFSPQALSVSKIICNNYAPRCSWLASSSPRCGLERSVLLKDINTWS